jgi:hypothetical protein
VVLTFLHIKSQVGWHDTNQHDSHYTAPTIKISLWCQVNKQASYNQPISPPRFGSSHGWQPLFLLLFSLFIWPSGEQGFDFQLWGSKAAGADQGNQSVVTTCWPILGANVCEKMTQVAILHMKSIAQWIGFTVPSGRHLQLRNGLPGIEGQIVSVNL